MSQLSDLRGEIDLADERILHGLGFRRLFPLNMGDGYFDSLHSFAAGGGYEWAKTDVPEGTVDLMWHLYSSSLGELCRDGHDPEEHERTLRIDAGLLDLLYNRIVVLGRQVAECKLEAEPDIVSVAGSSLLTERLRNSQREGEVIIHVKDHATIYGLNPDFAADFFRDVMRLTLQFECEYVSGRHAAA